VVEKVSRSPTTLWLCRLISLSYSIPFAVDTEKLDFIFVIMHNWPLDVIHLIMTKLQETEDPISEGEYWRDKRAMSALASCSQDLRSIAQPLLFEVVFIDGRARAEQLQGILRVNPILVLNTKILVIEDDDKPTSDCNLDWLPQLGRMLTYFMNLTCLHFSQMDMGSGSGYAALRSPNFCTVKRVVIDQCTFRSLPTLVAFAELFPQSEDLSVSYRLSYNSTFINQYDATPDTIYVGPSNSFADLICLTIEPTYVHEDKPWRLCESLFQLGRLQFLHTLKIHISPHSQSLSGLQSLLSHTARTLASLTIVWHAETVDHEHISISELEPLPQLRYLSLQYLQNWIPVDFRGIADVFACISRAANDLSEVLIDVDVKDHPHTVAQALWSAMETTLIRPQYTLTIKSNVYLHQVQEKSFTETDVRETLPQTSGRGALTIDLRLDECDEVECYADTQSPFA
jgi:hypothetical protein